VDSRAQNYARDKQIMVPAFGYKNSAAAFASAIDTKCIDIVEAILGPDIEMFMDGQCLYKNPSAATRRISTRTPPIRAQIPRPRRRALLPLIPLRRTEERLMSHRLRVCDETYVPFLR